jgi:hypothetical protein
MTWRDIRRVGSTEQAPHPSPVTTERRDTHITHAQSPVGIGIDAQMPNSMPRSEDDAVTRAGSRDFHDQPGSGGNTASRHLFF